MLKQKYSRQKEETDEMEKRRNKLEAQMNEVNSNRIITGVCIELGYTRDMLVHRLADVEKSKSQQSTTNSHTPTYSLPSVFLRRFNPA